MNHRDRQILCGLFLAKFDTGGLASLGFGTFTEAFNALGYGLDARPASIKNYRDELDPFFPNKRKGWANRPLREHCRRVLDTYREDSIERLGRMIKSFLIPSEEIADHPEIASLLGLEGDGRESTFAKRLITGRAAEHYFSQNYSKMAEFAGMSLTDTTAWGCGFDFKLTSPNDPTFRAVEVKGLQAKSGYIQLTELEHKMATLLRDSYSIVLVRNFAESPYHTVILNPANGAIRFKRVVRKDIRLSWTARID